MKKLKAFCKSFYKNIIVKRKFKALYLLMFNREFRARLEVLHELTKNCTRTEIREIHWGLIKPGHQLIYRGYAAFLRENEKTMDIPMIRVVQINSTGTYYVVVDGNHRLPALAQRAYRTNGRLNVR